MSERARSRRAAWRRPQNAGEFLDDGVADPPARRVAAVRSDDGANVDRAAFARLGGILAAREIGEGRRTQARHEVARLAPIHRRNEHDAVFQRRRRPGKNLAERIERRACFDRRDADAARQRILDVIHARENAKVLDRAPADGERRQAFLAAAPGEALHVAVGGDVSRLAGIADQRRCRGIRLTRTCSKFLATRVSAIRRGRRMRPPKSSLAPDIRTRMSVFRATTRGT